MKRMAFVLVALACLCLLPYLASAQGFLGMVQSYAAGRQAGLNAELTQQQIEQTKLQNELLRREVQQKDTEPTQYRETRPATSSEQQAKTDKMMAEWQKEDPEGYAAYVAKKQKEHQEWEEKVKAMFPDQ